MWKDYFGQKQAEEMNEERMISLVSQVKQYLLKQKTLPDFDTAILQLKQSMKELGVDVRRFQVDDDPALAGMFMVRMDCFMLHEDGTLYGTRMETEEGYSYYVGGNFGGDIYLDKGLFQ